MSTSENDNGAVESESKPLNDYVTSLVKEKYSLDASIHLNSIKLIDQGLYYRYSGPRSFGTQYVQLSLAVHGVCVYRVVRFTKLHEMRGF